MKNMLNIIMAMVIWVAWTLMCIYGTYDNTIKSAEPRAIEGGYEIEYHNTGQICVYQIEEGGEQE